MTELYYKHYIAADGQSRVTDGWSDGPCPDKNTESAILLNGRGGYQFRLLFPDGSLSEENPPLYEWDHGIPLYAYEDGGVRARTKAEIEADIAALPATEPQPSLDERMAGVEGGVNDLSAAMDALLTGEGMP